MIRTAAYTTHAERFARRALVAFAAVSVFSCVSFAQQVHVGIISAVKHKVQELKDKKDAAERVNVVSIDTSTVSGTVGIQGGTLSTHDGNASVRFPAGAVSGNVTVTISVNAERFIGQTFTPYAFTSSATGDFAVPVEITIKYDPAAVPTGMSPGDIKLAWIKSSGEQELLSTSVVDTVEHTVTASVSHFSTYCPVLYSSFGTILGSYNGVSCYSNLHDGTDIHNTAGTGNTTNVLFSGTTNQFETGVKWQAAEYAIRYYKLTYNKSIKGTANTPADLWRDAANRDLRSFTNGAGSSQQHPREGDIVIFANGTTASHAAIVRSVNTSNASSYAVHVIQQDWFLNNSDADATIAYSPSLNYLSTFNDDTNPYKVQGWLRSNTAPTIASLTADPETVTIGEAAVITCTASDNDGDTLTYAWSATSGAISGTGVQVTWAASESTGTATITCTVSDGSGGSAQQSVDVSVQPLSVTIYSDAGLLTEGTHVPDILKWGSNGNTGLTEPSGGGAPDDSAKYLTNDSGSETYVGWGITLDKNDSSYQKNLSSYANGYIKFYLKTSRALTGTERIFINVEGSGNTKSANIQIGSSYGWTGSTASWQEVSVPVSAVTGVNLAQVLIPFEITVDGGSSSLTAPITIDVDFIRWTNGTLNHAPTLSWTLESGYTTDGLTPETGTPSTSFIYRVKYTDQDNDSPATGYPKVHVLKSSASITGSPFTMSLVSGSNTSGAIYSYACTLSTGTDYTYYFQAYDVNSGTATGSPTLSVDAPDVSAYSGSNSSPTVISLTANPTSMASLSTSTIVCTATDSDGDTLTYTWSATSGTFTGTGSQVTWNSPDKSGTFTITCTVSDGNGHTAQKTLDVIVTGTTLEIYSDAGILTEGTHVPDILKWGSGATPNPGLTEQSGGGATADPSKYMTDASGTEEYIGWGVTLDKNDASYKRDMTSFSSGYIKFFLKTNRALTGSERIFINVEEPNSVKSANIIIGASHGFNSATASWQEVSVPISSLTGISLTNVHLPFEITADGNGSPLASAITMDVDYVRWTTVVGNHAPTLTFTGETNYTADGINPEAGKSTTTFTYRVKYTDADNDAPKTGYPKVYIKKAGVNITTGPFTMAFVSGAYNTGAIYTYSRALSTGTDFTYYYEAFDINNSTATGAATSSINSPDVYANTVINSSPTITSLVSNPSTVQISSTSVITCTASDPDGDTLSYVWNATSGTFTGTGSSVTFNAPSSTQTVTITCTVNDTLGASTQTVVNVTVIGKILKIYSDSGLLAENGQTPDVLTWGASGNGGFTEQSSGGAPGDTAKYYTDPSSESWFGWGIALTTTTTYARNLSAFSKGHVKFYIKSSRALILGENVKFQVEEKDGTKAIVTIASYGWTSSNSSWQEVSIPVSALSAANPSIDLTNIKLPFELAADSIGSAITIDIDYIRWTSD